MTKFFKRLKKDKEARSWFIIMILMIIMLAATTYLLYFRQPPKTAEKDFVSHQVEIDLNAILNERYAHIPHTVKLADNPKLEAQVKEHMYEQILQDPAYGTIMADYLSWITIGDTYLGEINPWMEEMVKKSDEAGIGYWIKQTDEGEIVVTDEYRNYAMLLCEILGSTNDKYEYVTKSGEVIAIFPE